MIPFADLVIQHARDRRPLLQGAGESPPRYRTPAAAIVVRGLIACAFVASGSYDKILGYFGFTDFVAYGLVVLGVLILRRREPNLARPHRVLLYPVTPILFLALCTATLARPCWAGRWSC